MAELPSGHEGINYAEVTPDVARRVCPYLGSLPLEQMDILLDMAASGQAIIEEQKATEQIDNKPELEVEFEDQEDTEALVAATENQADKNVAENNEQEQEEAAEVELPKKKVLWMDLPEVRRDDDPEPEQIVETDKKIVDEVFEHHHLLDDIEPPTHKVVQHAKKQEPVAEIHKKTVVPEAEQLPSVPAEENVAIKVVKEPEFLASPDQDGAVIEFDLKTPDANKDIFEKIAVSDPKVEKLDKPAIAIETPITIPKATAVSDDINSEIIINKTIGPETQVYETPDAEFTELKLAYDADQEIEFAFIIDHSEVAINTEEITETSSDQSIFENYFTSEEEIESEIENPLLELAFDGGQTFEIENVISAKVKDDIETEKPKPSSMTIEELKEEIKPMIKSVELLTKIEEVTKTAEPETVKKVEVVVDKVVAVISEIKTGTEMPKEAELELREHITGLCVILELEPDEKTVKELVRLISKNHELLDDLKVGPEKSKDRGTHEILLQFSKILATAKRALEELHNMLGRLVLSHTYQLAAVPI